MVDTPPPPQGSFANFSVRGFVGTGDQVIIPGLVIQDSSMTLLVRAVGPTLEGFGLDPATLLANPKITVYEKQRIGDTQVDVPILTADNWGEPLHDPDRIRQTAADLGAFPLDEGSLDSAFVITLDPGIYTFVVSGMPVEGVPGSDTGIVLIELYPVPVPEAGLQGAQADSDPQQ
jgi:hypothetical protein